MSRTLRWIVVGIAVFTAALAGARVALRTAATRSTEAQATHVATSNAAAPATRTRRKRAETPDVAPETTPSPDDEKPKPVLVRFRVETEAGKPIAGANIDVKWSDDAPSVTLVSDETGAARMPEAVATSDLGVVVHARGYVVSDRYARTDDLAIVTLRRGVDVAGRVLDGPSGCPIGGANLTAYESGTQGDPQIGEATTDATGGFLLADVFADRTWISVTAVGHVGAEFERDENAAGPFIVRLDPGGRVRGVVRGADGRPIADVWAVAVARTPLHGDADPGATADATGRFVIDGLRFGADYDVKVPYRTEIGTARVVCTTTTPEVVVELAPGLPTPPPRASLTVVVTSKGDPPHSASVRLCRDNGDCVRPPALDESLTTTFEDLAPGKVRLHAWADDRADASADVDLADGDAKRVEIALDRDIVVVGTVVDDVGTPIPGANVQCDELTDFAGKQNRSATSGTDGTFRLHLLTPGSHELWATSKTHARASMRVVAAPDVAPPVRFILARETTAHLRLRPVGVPRDVRVITEWYDGDGKYVEGDDDQHASDGLDLAIDAPPTARRLHVDVAGFIPIDLVVSPVFGEPLDLGEIVLDRGASLVVRVVDPDGHAVAPQEVSVNAVDGSRVADAAAQPDGTFEAHGFAPGPAVVVVIAPGFLLANAPVVAAKSGPPVVVTLPRGAYVRVRVVDADGRAAACDGVGAIASDDAATSLEQWMAGAFVGRLPPGRFRFVATRGDVHVEATETLVEGATQDVVLQFQR